MKTIMEKWRCEYENSGTFTEPYVLKVRHFNSVKGGSIRGEKLQHAVSPEYRTCWHGIIGRSLLAIHHKPVTVIPHPVGQVVLFDCLETGAFRPILKTLLPWRLVHSAVWKFGNSASATG